MNCRLFIMVTPSISSFPQAALCHTHPTISNIVDNALIHRYNQPLHIFQTSLLSYQRKKCDKHGIMDAYQQLIATLALTMGAAWASGINLYATVGVLGLLGASGNIALPESLAVLQDPLVIGAASLMYLVEFFADKTPGVDTGWDAIHSFIRIPAGVMLAAGAVGEVNPAIVIAGGLLGGTISATSHMVKAGSRVMINTSPEPVTNWTASILEDVAVIGGLFAALHYPVVFLILFFVFMALSIWFLPKLWKGVKAVFHKISAFYTSTRGQQPAPPPVKPPELPPD